MRQDVEEGVAVDDRVEPAAAPTRRRAVLTRPLVLGALLAVLGMNLSSIRPVFGIDSSFRVALTEARLDRLAFGTDIVFPYGPLGFLGGPTFLDRGLLAVAIVYQFAALWLLLTVLVFHLGRRGLRTAWSLVALVPFAVAISITDNIVPEVVSLTIVVVLVVLWQHRDAGLPAPTAWWVLALAGALSGAQVLVKFGPGAMACVVVAFIALSGPPRLRNVAVVVASGLGGFLAAWLVTGQPWSGLRPFFETARELSSGYQAAQAYGPSTTALAVVGSAVVLVVAVLVVGALRWIRADRRAWWAVVPIALCAWFALKQGFVRWDDWHVVGAYIMLALLVVAIRWERRLLLLPVATLVAATLVAFAADPGRLRSTWSDRTDALAVVASGRRQADEVAAAREGLRASYAVPAAVIDALEGGSVHAEEWDVNAVWGYDLEWEPLPVFQSYSTYTADLDELNAARYRSPEGPDGVLVNPATVDRRYAVWESPDARLALTCNFEQVAAEDDWSALRRAPDVCGPAAELGVERVAPGATLEIPAPTTPGALVVARFELPSDPLGKLLETVARPIRYAEVTLDGATTYRLVTGTADGAHLVRSPGAVDGRVLPHGPLDHTTISFANLGAGDVIVRFEEIPLRPA